MKRHKLCARSLVGLAIILIGSGGALASTYTVDGGGGGDFTTIQAAIDAATSGDIINVLAGTFQEQLSIDGKVLEINGAGQGVTTILTPATLGISYTINTYDYYAIIGVINGADLAIADLTIDGAGYSWHNSSWIGIGSLDSDCSVTNCEITGMDRTPWVDDSWSHCIYFRTEAAVARALLVEDCTIDDFTSSGIYPRGDYTTATITGNTITSLGPTDGPVTYGVRLNYGAMATIDDNIVSGHVFTGPTYAAAGILVYLPGAPPLITNNTISDNYFGIWLYDSHATIENNTVTGTVAGVGDEYYELIVGWTFAGGRSKESESRAIPHPGGDDPEDRSARDGSKSTHTYIINGNTLDGGGGLSTWGIGLWSEGEDQMVLEAANNDISNCYFGLGMNEDAPGTWTSATIHDNSFVGSIGYAVHKNSTGVADASGNWWGDLTPGEFLGDVDYTPWLAVGTDTEPGTPGFQGDYSTLHVDAVSPQVGTTGRVQEGIDLVSGSTLHLADGTYTGPNTISAGIHIIGASEAGVIVEGSAGVPVNGVNTFTVAAPAAAVTFEAMTVRNGDYGIRSSAGNVNVLHCTFYHNGWDGTPYPTPYAQGTAATHWGTYATNGGAMRIENSAVSEIGWCTVYENDRGIRFQDGANGNIHDNEIYTNIEAGIYLAASSYNGATGCTNTVVTNNQSSGNYEHGLLSIGGLGNSFTGNTCNNNWNTGIMIWHPGDITVEGNTFDGNNAYGFNGVGSSADASGTVYLDGAIGDAGATYAVRLLGNDIKNGGPGDQAQADGLHLSSPLVATGITVGGNLFTGMANDIAVLAQAATTTVTENSFSSPTGINNGDPAMLDASGNYYGSTVATTVAGMITGNVDYTPWLGGGTADVPGFTGNFSTLYVDDGSPQAGGSGRIQEGVNLVTASTVNILPGTYPGAINIPAAMPMTLVGAGMTQTFLTGGMVLSDGVDGLALQQFAISGLGAAGAVIRAGHPNNDFSMDYVLMDGEGATNPTKHGYAGGRMTGDVTVTNCEFKDVAGWSLFDSASSGWETVMGTITFTDNWIHECDGAVAFRGDNTDRINLAVVSGNVWENINDNWNPHPTVQNAWACVEVHGVDVLNVFDNVFDDVNMNQWGEGQGLQAWRVGAIDIYDNTFSDNWQGIWLPGLGTEPAPTGSVHDNTFTNIADYAVFANHGGGGFLGGGLLDARYNDWGSYTGPYHPTLNPSGTGENVGDHVLFIPWTGMAAGDIVPVTTGPLNCSQTVTLTFNYTADSSTPDMFLYNAVVTATPGLIFGTVTDLLPFGTSNNQFFAMSTGTNEWTITGSTVGNPTYPVVGPGTFGMFSIQFSATGDVVGSVDFSSLTLRDPNNNTIPVVLTGATITYDCTAPAAVTGITAGPRHNKVDVAWTHDGTDVGTYKIYRGLWHNGTVGNSAYPEYDDVAAPTPSVRPANAGAADLDPEWILAGTTTVGTNTFTDVGEVGGSGTFDPNGADRGVYYYEVFPMDLAANSAPGAASNDRATNYWLGDVWGVGSDPIPNGLVQSYDMNVLGAAFGTCGPGGSYNNVADIGPTDDWSRVGIPTTDSCINFEDLMIISMNFGVVTAAKEGLPISSVVDLAWVRYDDGRQALRLVNGTGVKGLNVRANVPVRSVIAGDLLDAQSELTFLRNVGENLDVSVAVTGVNVGFNGSGELFVVDAESAIDVANLTIKVRGYNNSELKFKMGEATGSQTPRVFALHPNYPNPFNPLTKISFSLPEEQFVRLAVYGVDGQRIATLVDEVRGVGLHEVLWNGCNDAGQSVASGLYFYRIEAGTYCQVHKMTLMK